MKFTQMMMMQLERRSARIIVEWSLQLSQDRKLTRVLLWKRNDSFSANDAKPQLDWTIGLFVLTVICLGNPLVIFVFSVRTIHVSRFFEWCALQRKIKPRMSKTFLLSSSSSHGEPSVWQETALCFSQCRMLCVWVTRTPHRLMDVLFLQNSFPHQK